MKTNKLLGLEALRGFAAIYVFIHHAHLLPNLGIGRFLYFGQEAVILFFLLSGFVICYSSSKQQLDWKKYLLNRIKRIYPIFLVALLLAYCSQSLIMGHWVEPEAIQLMGNIFMLQDVSGLKRGVWFDTYYGNSPLWSLSYEWWFYLLFIPLGLNKKYSSNEHSLVIALLVSILGFFIYQYHPNQICLFAGYFFIWWAGVELAKEYNNAGVISFGGQRKMLLGLTFMMMLWGSPVVMALVEHKSLQFGIDPILQWRHYFAALFFVTTGIGVSQLSPRSLFKPSWIMRPFIWLAPISYAIYVIHQPLLNIVHHFFESYSLWFCTMITFSILVLLGWLLEVKMQVYVNYIFHSVNFETKRRFYE